MAVDVAVQGFRKAAVTRQAPAENRLTTPIAAIQQRRQVLDQKIIVVLIFGRAVVAWRVLGSGADNVAVAPVALGDQTGQAAGHRRCRRIGEIDEIAAHPRHRPVQPGAAGQGQRRAQKHNPLILGRRRTQAIVRRRVIEGADDLHGHVVLGEIEIRRKIRDTQRPTAAVVEDHRQANVALDHRRRWPLERITIAFRETARDQGFDEQRLVGVVTDGGVKHIARKVLEIGDLVDGGGVDIGEKVAQQSLVVDGDMAVTSDDAPPARNFFRARASS